MEPLSLTVEFHSSLQEVDADEWNALVQNNNPFVRYEFLSAMEAHACVGEHFGWIPTHLMARRGEELVAAMPLYKKLNSYGEFVFDHSWAEAWQRAGLDYFPKLVSAVPYTPAVGQRMLVKPGLESQSYPLMWQATRALAEELKASSVHWLFPSAGNLEYLMGRGAVIRHDCQYHWRNQGYTSFEEFLGRLSARKRKNIRREQRKVQEAGVTLRRLNGHTASGQDWADFALFYNRLFDEKWGMATFNQAFFQAVARALPDQVLLVLADLDGECIAGSLMYLSDTTLYGRHWGCSTEIDSLHFEACYYQGIEFCIERGLEAFEPGAQGEHKLARGFEPVQTRSAHWIAEQGFRSSIERFARFERQGVREYMGRLQSQSPFRKDLT